MKEVAEKIITSSTGNLLDTAIDLSEYIVDNCMYNEKEHEYFIFKKKLIAIPLILEVLLKTHKTNKKIKQGLKQIVETVEKEVKELKHEIYTLWKKGLLHEDRKVNILHVRKASDKMYYNLVQSLPSVIEENAEERVKKILNID